MIEDHYSLAANAGKKKSGWFKIKSTFFGAFHKRRVFEKGRRNAGDAGVLDQIPERTESSQAPFAQRQLIKGSLEGGAGKIR